MISVYPGSFDPPTLGHLDIIRRAAKLSSKLYVAVLDNSAKNATYSAGERMEMLRLITSGIPNVCVTSFSGLLVDYCRQSGAECIIRGLRAMMDFEYEFQMALANRGLSPDIETVFIPTSVPYLYLSSSLAKEICRLGGDVSNILPNSVEAYIKEHSAKHTEEYSKEHIKKDEEDFHGTN